MCVQLAQRFTVNEWMGKMEWTDRMKVLVDKDTMIDK